MIKKFFTNCAKPEGFMGKMVIRGMNRGHKSLFDWTLPHMHLKSDDSVLDVGCGGGANISYMLKICANGRVDGIDYSTLSVEQSIKKNSAEVGRRCTVKQADVSAIPFEDASYDVITAFETIYFWPDMPRAFAEIKRLLKPNGRFVVTCEMGDPSNTTWTNMIDSMTIYSGMDIQKRLEEAGFTNVALYEKKNWFCIVARKGE